MKLTRSQFFAVAGIGVAALVGWRVSAGFSEGSGGSPGRGRGPAPVEVVAVERGPISLHRSFSGSLEALAEFEVAPNVGGRIQELTVDVGDVVRSGQVVARIDDAEFEQQVALAEAEMSVAQANVAEARSRSETAARALERVRVLGERGVVSQSELDESRTAAQSADAALQVALAQVERAQAGLAAARIRLSYAEVRARWEDGDEERVVAQRFADAGDTVAANTALLRIVEIDPINAVVSVTERDYGRLRPGMPADLHADAYPDRLFEARVTRISPVFEEASRQARILLQAPNRDRALKPGMFVRATLVLDHAPDAWIVPEAALTRRDESDGVFFIATGEDGTPRAQWSAVRLGIRDEGRVQILPEGPLRDRVVTLGQQMLDEGAPVVIREASGAPAPSAPPASGASE